MIIRAICPFDAIESAISFSGTLADMPALLTGELVDETHGKQVGLAGIEPAT
jgi:hypothetical protein